MTFHGAVVDLDGTVYRGDDLIPGADRGVAALREAGIDVLFFSNNPTRSPAEFAAKLRALGVDADPGDVLTSGVVTAEFLAAEHAGDRLFVVGEDGLRSTLREAGLTTTDTREDADVLVASFDRGFDYDRLTDALRVLQRDDVVFVGTDPDRTIPTGDGCMVPGSGAIIGAIAATTERDPDYVLGKPSQYAVDAARSHLGVPADECLVVGDRLDTDIEMGERAGMTTVLVRTGVSDERTGRGSVEPDHVVDSLENVIEVLDA
ncbi:HAD-IIA family hydrolase [Halobacteriaceae archaeon GCM10025711]